MVANCNRLDLLRVSDTCFLVGGVGSVLFLMTCASELGVHSPPLLADSFSPDTITPDTVWGTGVHMVQNIRNGHPRRTHIAGRTADAEKRCCHWMLGTASFNKAF